MTNLNTTFNSSKATGRILTNLNSVAEKTGQINTCVVQNANDICQFVIHGDFEVLSSNSFTAEELTKQVVSFATDCLGIPEANYSKEEHFAKSKRDSLRESMKIAQVLMAKSLYADLDEKKTKRVSNQGRMMISNPNTVAQTDRFNKDNDEQVRVGKADLLSIYQTVYGNSGNKKTVSTLSKSYAEFYNKLKATIKTVKETKTVLGGVLLDLPEGVEPEDLMTWKQELDTVFTACTYAHINAMTPEQAVKKGFIDRVDQHPKHKDFKKAA
jgi:hypothetical protein